MQFSRRPCWRLSVSASFAQGGTMMNDVPLFRIQWSLSLHWWSHDARSHVNTLLIFVDLVIQTKLIIAVGEWKWTWMIWRSVELAKLDHYNCTFVMEKSWHDFEKHIFTVHSIILGNKLTLETRPSQGGIDIRQELLKFHSTYYSSNLMGLCVLGRGKSWPLTNVLFKCCTLPEQHSCVLSTPCTVGYTGQQSRKSCMTLCRWPKPYYFKI